MVEPPTDVGVLPNPPENRVSMLSVRAIPYTWFMTGVSVVRLQSPLAHQD